jgi:pimeloyl-ACP methyl ester carboxylesterase
MKLRWKILLGLVLVIVVGMGYWTYDKEDRMSRVAPEGLAALESDGRVTVTKNEWIVFTPSAVTPTKGLIFYPGGEVDERGYALPLHEIAAAGYLVVLVPMPLQLAVFAPDKATEVIAAYPEINNWAIAGHSLGGSMAARYAFHHPENIAGLIMWDAYPADDMSASTLAVRMIHRSDATGATPEDYAPQLYRLPEQTEFVPLEGGQHLNFGNFIAGRMYRNEPEPELIPAKQRAMAVAATVEFMQAL